MHDLALSAGALCVRVWVRDGNINSNDDDGEQARFWIFCNCAPLACKRGSVRTNALWTAGRESALSCVQVLIYVSTHASHPHFPTVLCGRVRFPSSRIVLRTCVCEEHVREYRERIRSREYGKFSLHSLALTRSNSLFSQGFLRGSWHVRAAQTLSRKCALGGRNPQTRNTSASEACVCVSVLWFKKRAHTHTNRAYMHAYIDMCVRVYTELMFCLFSTLCFGHYQI